MKSIICNGEILGIIISHEFIKIGANSFTLYTNSKQPAGICYPKGCIVPPHVHNPHVKMLEFTQEVLVIKLGKVRIDFYDDDRQYVESHVLKVGDVVLLAAGGHGLKILEDSVIIEVAQRPFKSEEYYKHFSMIDDSTIVIK